MRNILSLFVCFIFLCCGSRKADNQKTKETTKIDTQEVKKENVQEAEFSEKEITTTMVELNTSKLAEITIDYKGKEGDQIEITKERGKLIIKGSGEIGIKSKKEDARKDKVNTKIEAENATKNKETTLDSKINIKQSNENKNQTKQVKQSNYSIFYFISVLLVIAGIVYLLKRFKVF
ncbi:hypothetical protein Ga0061079_1143 [Apibacter mensalis]|jgi:uncharacterized protein YcfL|uniref:Uncharacterized protein n=1 Tax=Apibacter mensalis TaxID=1586267 RepID=A0A0X3APB8_9FLAO|nr:hypothetical protein [Apibacter mensalis]CVK16989.1 hypothetical protein Ga0061079_1143 [Apibacter mensalis]